MITFYIDSHLYKCITDLIDENSTPMMQNQDMDMQCRCLTEYKTAFEFQLG